MERSYSERENGIYVVHLHLNLKTVRQAFHSPPLLKHDLQVCCVPKLDVLENDRILMAGYRGQMIGQTATKLGYWW